MASGFRTWLTKRKLARRFGCCNGDGLHRAVRQCDLQAITAMIQLGVEVESRDPAGRTALFQAVRMGEQRMTEELLRVGASADAADKEGNTSLMEAVKSGDKHILERLLLEKPQVNKRNQQGETALILAVKEGNTTFTRLLLGQGAEANLADQRGRTPLMLAVMDSKTAIITSLLDAGADPAQQDLSGQSCMDIPVGSPRIFQLLRKHLKQQGGMKEESPAGTAIGGLIDDVSQKAQQWLGTRPSDEIEAKGKQLLEFWLSNLGTADSPDPEELVNSGAGLLVLLSQEVQRGLKQFPTLSPETRDRLWTSLESLISNLATGLSRQPGRRDGEPEQHIHFHLPPLTKAQEKELDSTLKVAITHGADRAADLLKRLGDIRSNGHHELNGSHAANHDSSTLNGSSHTADRPTRAERLKEELPGEEQK